MGTYRRFLHELQQTTFYSYKHCIQTHERYCQSRTTEPNQRFEARGERIALTLNERIENGVQVTTTDVIKKLHVTAFIMKLIFTRPVFVAVHRKMGTYSWCVTVTMVNEWFLVAQFHWLQSAVSYQVYLSPAAAAKK